ncbi:secretion pathway protein Sls2/Rcy1 [Tothia fuscella]|uniref:Secretion pathway protein Sls2/Rcy1 n=1 Tax=Tothia fuscella TaxID=1048955 RepID=A0A9P4P0D3_9PEZI|nr:secretion pathway protein Sls2/Rcy1 [Tothia fuscella]
MSNFKRASVTGPPAQRNVLASLRATTIVDSKPILPAELIASILDYLPIPALLRFARVSKRFQEMVYDDSRWVQRLKSMGCWNDAEARQRFEDSMKRKLEGQKALNGSTSNGTSGGPTANRGSTLFDASMEEEKQRRSLEKMGTRKRGGTNDAGFDSPTLMSNGSAVSQSTAAHKDPTFALKVISVARSIRGFARQEYGKIYGALSPYYYDLARSKSHTDPILFRTCRDPEQQAAMLSQLKIFAKSDFAQGWRSREEKLDSMIGIFENAVLREFEQGLEAKDIDGRMRKYAHVLVTLNGGSAGMDTFIQNHPLMTEKERLGNPLECLEGGTLNLQPSHDFFSQLAGSLNVQAGIIDRVFPPSVDVLKPFIDRVAEDVITEYITALFDEAHDGNIEDYLKAVSGVFEQCLRFAISLVPSRASSPQFTEQVTTLVVHCFEPHVDLYLQEELSFFKTKSETEVGNWEKRLSEEQATSESFFLSNVSRQAAKQDFLSSFRKVVMLPVTAISAPFASAKPAPGTRSSAMGSALEPNSRSSTPNPMERSNSPKQQEAPTSELAAKAAIMSSRLEGIKSLFSIEIALNLIHAAKASLERAALFVRLGGQSGEEAREQCETIFIILLQILGTRHIKSGFDKAVMHLSAYNPREITEHGNGQQGVEPLVTFLELVNVGDLIQQMVDVFYVQELVQPKLSDRDDFLSPAIKEKKKFEQILDERVAAGLNKGIDVLMNEVEYICATLQKPTDFNPVLAAGEGLSDIGPTETAKRVVHLVESHTSMLVGSTEKNMLDVFNQEVGVRLFTALCKNLKRQRVSVDGAIVLISDTNHYSQFIRSLRNKSLTQYFDALREMTQIYLIDPSHAREIGKIIADPDRYHGIFRAEEVYEFAERRADWFGVKKEVERAMYGMGCMVM